MYLYHIYLSTYRGYEGDIPLISGIKYTEDEFTKIVREVQSKCDNRYDLEEVLNKLIEYYGFKYANTVYVNLLE